MRLQQLEFATRSIHAIAGHDAGNGFDMLTAEFALDPVFNPLGSAVRLPSLSVIGKIHKVADGDFLWLEISDVDNPDTASISVVCQGHLLSGLLQLNGVDPLVVSWVANIVEM